MSYIVNKIHKTDWNEFIPEEKMAVENTILLVGLLYKMCQVSLVSKSNNENEMNAVNKREIERSIQDAERIIGDIV